MPYIHRSRRNQIDDIIETGGSDLSFIGQFCSNPGELNYVFSKIAAGYFNDEGRRNYQAINDIVGALEGAKLEIYRRVAAPYEDTKIVANGDVYEEA